MDRQELLERIGTLVAQEHELRSRVQAGELSPGEEQDKIRRLEPHSISVGICYANGTPAGPPVRIPPR